MIIGSQIKIGAYWFDLPTKHDEMQFNERFAKSGFKRIVYDGKFIGVMVQVNLNDGMELSPEEKQKVLT